MVFPVIAPAVIVGVTNGEQLLMTKYAGREYTGWALIAGFCEVGETVEDTVRREVLEEVGLTVTSAQFRHSRYYPRTNTLILNFTVTVEEGDVHPNEEIDAWRWFSRDEAREAILPGSMAARFLNEVFDRLEGKA